jgi:SAM-dependent methyltransferase
MGIPGLALNGVRRLMSDFDAYAGEHPFYDLTPGPIPGLSEALRDTRGTLVEIGSGDGAKLRTLLDSGAASTFTEIVATDISDVRVRRLRERLPEATAMVADALSLPFASDSVDFVLSDQVIEHVPDDLSMAREIHRVLRPGGRACVGSVLKRRWAWYFHRNNGRWVLDPTHVREYGSLEEFRRVFERAGFTVQGIRFEPMPYGLGEVIMRILVRLRITSDEASIALYNRSRLLRALSKVRAAVPGYFGCWAYLRKG